MHVSSWRILSANLNRNVELLVVAPLPILPCIYIQSCPWKYCHFPKRVTRWKREKRVSVVAFFFRTCDYVWSLIRAEMSAERTNSIIGVSVYAWERLNQIWERFSERFNEQYHKRSGNVLSEGTTFHSRYFKASSWSDYLYQVLYRAVRSTPYLW